MIHLRRAWLSVLVVLGGAACALGLAGCGGTTVKPAPSVTHDDVVAPETDKLLESARDKLYETTDVGSCQGAIRQLNVYFPSQPDLKWSPRGEDERVRLGCEPDEWTEVNGPTFTGLDGHHLEQCFLLRDAAQSLGVESLPDLEKANLAFAWIVRQIRLTDSRGEIEIAPPKLVLRRGWGSARQRTDAFLSLIQQLNLEGCLVTFPGKATVVLPGVLVGKDVYLFDSRMGLPVPGAGEGGIATLAEIRARPEVLKKLTLDPKHSYDLTAEQVKKAEAYPYYTVSALAQRMQHLQRLLRPRVNVTLAVDPASAEKKLRAALKEDGTVVKTWNRPGDLASPARALRQFLPAQEGGADVPQPVALRRFGGYDLPGSPLQAAMPRAMLYDFDRIPWARLPQQVRALPPNSELGRRARELFAGKYRQYCDGPRELILRGRYEQANEAIPHLLDVVKEQSKIRTSEPKLDHDVADWITLASKTYGEVRAGVARGELTAADEEQAIAELWAQSKLMLLCLDALNPILAAETLFHSALNNHEQAERLQAQVLASGSRPAPAKLADAWQAAADGWWTFTKYSGAHPAAPAAYRMHARALERLGNTDAARVIWENLGNGLLESRAAPMTELERVACLYRASQLKAK